MKKIKMTMLGLLCVIVLTGCGKDTALEEYQEDMSVFFEHMASYDEGMNAIDASSDDAVEQLLGYLDQVEEEIAWMAELEVPEQFSAVDSLADEADENMKQAVELYHRAYGEEIFNDAVAQAAREYYDRANIRIQYIIMILHGEIPEGEGVTYTEENSILGGGYLNQDDEEDNEDNEAGKEEQSIESP